MVNYCPLCEDGLRNKRVGLSIEETEEKLV
jgi:hypothetical protein